MRLFKKLSFLFLFSLLVHSGLFGDITNGYVRLILHENTGRFSLYYLSDSEKMRYTPLISSRDPRTSFISLYVNGKTYTLGDSKIFNNSVERHSGGDPALVFSNAGIVVTEVFSLIKTGNANYANGVLITITVENVGRKDYTVGMKMLFDTELGEKSGLVPFVTDQRVITSEAKIEKGSDETFWISRGENVALMGSIVNPVDSYSKPADYIHIANWKRLNEAPWKLNYYEERSFSNFPYSIGDSAVCYYYEPELLAQGAVFTYSVVLSTEDIEWYATAGRPVPVPVTAKPAPVPETPPVPPPPPPVIERPPVIEKEIPTIDIAAIEQEALEASYHSGDDWSRLTLMKLQEILNQFISGAIYLNEQDLVEIETAIKKHSNGI